MKYLKKIQDNMDILSNKYSLILVVNLKNIEKV